MIFFRDDDFGGVAGVHSYNTRLKDKKPEDKPGKNQSLDSKTCHLNSPE